MSGALSLVGLGGVDLWISFAPMFQCCFCCQIHIFHFSIDSWFICFPWWYNDKLEVLHADRITLKTFMNRNRIWGRGRVLVRPVWALSGLLQTALMWCFYCGLFSMDKLFCMYSTLILGYPLVIYLMTSWCLCSFPIWHWTEMPVL